MTTSELNKHVEAIKTNPLKRLTAPSPDFFIKVQKWCVFLAFAAGALSAYLLSVNPESKIGIACGTFAGFIGVFGTILAKLPVDSDKIKQEKQLLERSDAVD